MELDKTYYYDAFMEQIHNLVEQWPHLLAYKKVGVSHDNREIPGILLGSSENCLFLSAGIHGRESINPILLLQMIEEYCERMSKQEDDPIKKLLKDNSIFFLPLVNPDGYQTALQGYQMIRSPILRHSMKMAGIPHEEWKANARGVDINRNFPCKSFYKNDSNFIPASELETLALIQVFREYPKSIGYIDFHSRGRIIYYYRGAMSFGYNHKGKHMAKQLKRLTNYHLGKKRDEFFTKYDGGNSVNYYSETYGKLALTIETVEDSAIFPLDVSYQQKTYQEISQIPLTFIIEYTSVL